MLCVLVFWALCAFVGLQDADSALGARRKRFEREWVQPIVHPAYGVLLGMSLVGVSHSANVL